LVSVYHDVRPVTLVGAYVVATI